MRRSGGGAGRPEQALQAIYILIKENVKGSNKEQIKERMTAWGGKVTTDLDEATHIIHPKVDGNSNLNCRPVFKRGDKCLVHFMQMPDSSDNWGVCYSENEPVEAPEEGVPKQMWL